MLDRKLIVENAELVKENCRRRGVKADVDSLVELELVRRGKLSEAQELNRLANEKSKQIGSAKSPEERESLKEQGRQLREQKDAADSILMVGHNPGLEDVIFDLVPDDGTSPLRDLVEVKFPTASFAVLELDISHWADLRERCGRLAHLIRPRDLDPALGPETV